MPDSAEQQAGAPATGQDQATQSGTQGGAASSTASTQAAAQDSGGPQRPEWAPEKFWDSTKGEVRVADLAKSYTEAQKLIGRRGDEAKAAARSEVEAELFGRRPAAPEAYELGAVPEAVDVGVFVGAPPADFQPEPGKTYLQLNPDSKALGMMRQMAHRAGASNEEMQALLTEVARENGVRVPTQADREADAAKVWAQLGENGQRRAQFVWGQLQATLGQEMASDLEGVLGSAKAIAAVEELMARATGNRFAPSTAGLTGGRLTENEIFEQMRDPRYGVDKAYTDKIAQQFKILYPG